MTKKLVSFDDQAEPGQGLPAAVKAELSATYGTKAEVGEVVAQVESVAAHSLPRSLVPSMPVEVDVTQAVARVGEKQVDLTTYVGGTNAIVHPSVLFFDEGWNGYRYWMAYTPYNDADPQVENPSIAVSQDGEKWITPPGLTNPIEPSPDGPGYNADPVLCMTPDGQTMNMVFKVNDASKQLALRTSTDGVTWTPKRVILDHTYEDVSPAILWDQIYGYRMWTIVYNAEVTGGVNTMYVRTADDPAGPWSAPIACSVTGFPPGVKIWHHDIKRVGQQYHCVLATEQDGSQPAGYGGQLFFGKSGDGLNWEFSTRPIMETGNLTQQAFYKAGILPKITPRGLTYDMWYSGTGDFRMYKTRVTFDRDQIRERTNSDILAATASLSPWLIGDRFARPDSTSLGAADTGQVWQTTMGQMGIAGKTATATTNTNSRATIQAGVANVRAGFTIVENGGSGYVMLRYTDASNLIRIGFYLGGLRVQKIIGGVVSSIGDAGTFNRIRPGDRIEAETLGSRLRVFINGMLVLSRDEPALVGATTVGLNVDTSTTRLRDFTVRAL